MRVLVLDGNENQAVATVRSLGRAGHQVEVAAHTPWSKAGLSRFAKKRVQYPAPQESKSAFIACMLEYCARAPGTLLLPMTERTTLPLSESREQIELAGGKVILAPHETILRAFDKNETTKLAEQLGIAVPRTRQADSRANAHEVAAALTYPLVLKPTSSESIGADGKVKATGAPVYAREAGELDAAIEDVFSRSPSALLQEFVPGGGGGYFALMNQGELRAEFAHRRIRDVRPTGSGSAVRESAHPDPRMRDAGLKILHALKWHGVAMVEFRVRPDGSPVFLEVNGRFWNSLPLAVYSGVDFPKLLVDIAERGDCDNVLQYRAGVRCRWILGDARHLIEVLRGPPAGFPGPFPERLPTVLEFFRPVPGTFHDNFTIDDPLPEVGDWADFLARKLPGGLDRWTKR